MIENLLFGVCGFAAGTILTTVCMVASVWLDDRLAERKKQ